MCDWVFLFLGDDTEVADGGVNPSNELGSYFRINNNDNTILKAVSYRADLELKHIPALRRTKDNHDNSQHHTSLRAQTHRNHPHLPSLATTTFTVFQRTLFANTPPQTTLSMSELFPPHSSHLLHPACASLKSPQIYRQGSRLYRIYTDRFWEHGCVLQFARSHCLH